ncbi:ovostatin homolog [Apodemus sylvaticus]|uniref:ovostatin homolog n=1 Tax=Apodemus sylvaticus TaxID=10129 RepID=UPI002243537E|nr:ovostatin homolog [Apodemus sylvaticus]
MVPAILLSALLLHLTDAAASEPQYILWVSSVVQRFSSEKACLHLLNLNESVSLSVTLEYDGSNTTIFDQHVEEGNFYACANFKVSQISSEQLAFVTLLVQGNTLKIFERRAVAIAAEENATFVQTDTPVHKPGDTVHFRVVTLNTWLKPVDDSYPLITVQDPQGNVIFQWINVTTFRNITQLSFQLTPEPILGDYVIIIKKQSGITVVDHFTVNRDVLPKFEVELNAPETITIADHQFQMVTCAKYTYGQPVQGKAQIKVCRELFSSGHCENEENEICEQFTAQLKDGCAAHIVSTKVFQLYRSGLFMTLNVNVVVTEFGTGVQISKTQSVFITSMLGTVSFENVDSFYRRGIAYTGTLKFSGPNNAPMVNKLLQLELNGKPVGNYTTDENGEAQFSINTSEMFDAQISLKAVYVRPRSCHRVSWLYPEYMDGYFSASRFYSQTSSFMKIIPEPKQLPCDQEKMVSVLYSLSPEAYKGASGVTFFYLVMVRGGIFLGGQKEVRVQAWNGSFSFPISITADLAPEADLFVYTLHPSGEIVADSVKLRIEKCFKNKVSIKFSKEKDRPGSNTSLHLQAAPDSFCALRAVDKSALLLNHGQEMTPESVYDMLPYIHQYGYFYNGINLDDEQADPCIPQKDLFHNGVYYTPTSNVWDGDLSNLVRNMGLKIFTNLRYRKPEVCSSQETLPLLRTLDHSNERIMMYGGGAPPSAFHDSVDSIIHAKLAIQETVRTSFPRTWIWDLINVDSSGSANVSFLVPDTITRWETSAFCVNGNAGFGISRKVSLQISQPFFMEVTSPFSIVRSEQSDLVATVFNYLTTCVEISVQLEASENYEASINTQSNTDSEVLQAGERKTYVWTIIPKTLGKVNVTVVATSKKSSACPNDANQEQDVHWKDTVVKTLRVESEGIKKETTQSFLICPKGTNASKQILLELPSNVVEGSARSFVTVVGDILGVAMQNLESLLQTSYGCAEQNIAQLASDIYILDYLRTTEQLTEEVKSKALFLLSNGYQNHLSFKNYDGSYDAFCQNNQEGSTWLSALSFKIFEKMKEYIFIEETIPKQTLIWLVKKQKSNGCFRREEKPVNNAQEGSNGDEEDIALTAYVVGVFLEVGLNSSFPALRNGLYCLEEAFSNGVTSGYIQAILAYVFALAGKEEQVKSLLPILDQSATKTNNMIYWGKDEKSDNSPSFIPSALSGEAEKTCYVLLAVLSQDTQDLDYASKIVQWLAQRMNSHGGFSAMQDTTVCLLALTRYMKLTGSNPQNTITVSTEDSEEVFHVNRDNRLLVQHSKVSKGPRQYTVDVEGDGCSFIQATLRYNVPLPKEASGFSLSVKTGKSNSSDEFQTKFDLTVTLTYTGAHESSGTVLVDVGMLSGFTPVLSSIEELKFNSQVMKTDLKNGHILFYLKNVPKEATSFTFSIEQTNLVVNIQPAPVTVHNYEKDEYAFDSYNINSNLDSQ